MAMQFTEEEIKDGKEKIQKAWNFVMDEIICNPAVWLAGVGIGVYIAGFKMGYRKGLKETADCVILNVGPLGW